MTGANLKCVGPCEKVPCQRIHIRVWSFLAVFTQPCIHRDFSLGGPTCPRGERFRDMVLLVGGPRVKVNYSFSVIRASGETRVVLDSTAVDGDE